MLHQIAPGAPYGYSFAFLILAYLIRAIGDGCYKISFNDISRPLKTADLIESPSCTIFMLVISLSCEKKVLNNGLAGWIYDPVFQNTAFHVQV